MALFQKKPVISSSAPLYTLGANKTVLIIGLGNTGNDYARTRHNVGFEALDEFATKNSFGAWISKKDLHCELAMHQLGDNRVILCKPTTLMNNSGRAAQAVQHFYKVDNKNTLVVYDELAIPFGQLRTRLGGTDAGHNGVKSLIEHIGPEFGRLRIGIGSELATQADAADFVLAKFNKKEQGDLPLILREASTLITEYIFSVELKPETRNLLS